MLAAPVASVMDSRLRERQRIAAEVARRLTEYGCRDDPARVRAEVARELGITDPRALPGRNEIDAALSAHLALFGPAGQVAKLERLRRAAIEAMEALSLFDPRLVGPVLDGHAGPGSIVEIHLHADDPDQVVLWLSERGVPASRGQHRIRLDVDTETRVPAYGFSADGIAMSLVLLPERNRHLSPIDRISGRPMKRGTLEQVRRLVGAT
ncbi:hypothetical protein B1808_04775 [Pseudofulvimonas gallinarii]|uniref:Uncharacterized protein n=2 Tax=Pseudofulvimonas gallinarii TaxID=634155 RepID=A0A4R3LP60_9GAMM|nr:hypothetical protein EDC25_10383 [Pseudofulvimonas gallinarii]THD14156.1 hypothetical protein B1808_04775 [Pseudofulvimonas gallinarii]